MKWDKESSIILYNSYGDRVSYDITDLTIFELVDVFIRMARHIQYTDKSIDEGFKKAEVIDNH